MSVKQDTKPAPADIDYKALAAELDRQKVVLSDGLIERDLADDEFDPFKVALNAIDALRAENAQIKRQLSAQKGAATRARNEAAEIEAQLPPRPRNFGGEKAAPERDRFNALIADAKNVELAFVGEGGREIEGLAPRRLDGGLSAISAGRHGVRLLLPSLKLHGPAAGSAPWKLAGYALLVDGDLVAHSHRGEMLTIAPGTTMELKDDVIF